MYGLDAGAEYFPVGRLPEFDPPLGELIIPLEPDAVGPPLEELCVDVDAFEYGLLPAV